MQHHWRHISDSSQATISFSDGTNLTYDAPTLIRNALAPVENRLTQLESQQQETNNKLTNHINDFEALGLSVVDGLLCITYNEENDGNE